MMKFKKLFPRCLDDYRFVVMFFKGRNSVMCGCRGARRDTNIVSWKKWKLFLSLWPGSFGPPDGLVMLFVCREVRVVSLSRSADLLGRGNDLERN